jgi:hypothetical protein
VVPYHDFVRGGILLKSVGCTCQPSPTYIKLIAFELAGEDRDRRENPVLSRLKIAFFALHKRG